MKQMAGLNSFLPRIHSPRPTTINKAPHKPTYLFKNVQRALIEASGHPLVELNYKIVTQGSTL